MQNALQQFKLTTRRNVIVSAVESKTCYSPWLSSQIVTFHGRRPNVPNIPQKRWNVLHYVAN